MPQATRSRQARLPGQKCVKKKKKKKRQQAHTSCPVHLPTCHVYYAMHADV